MHLASYKVAYHIAEENAAAFNIVITFQDEKAPQKLKQKLANQLESANIQISGSQRVGYSARWQHWYHCIHKIVVYV